MKTIDVSQATGSLGQYARELDREPLVLTVGGRPIAALLPIDDADLDSVALEMTPKFLALIEQARAQRRAGAGLSTDEVRRELGLS
jgi:antitoxin (DNA-binding transcriptional repressor) of toxin-antitoxin stability system